MDDLEYESDSPPVPAPTTSTATPGEDFYDARGRRWIYAGKAEFKELDIHALHEAQTPSSRTQGRLPEHMTVAELADVLRPRRLVGEHEYRLAEPDHELARRIHEMLVVPSTNGSPPVITPPDGVENGFIIGTDDRVQVGSSAAWPASTFALTSQGCTATMIGRNTALSAAHCFYSNGWISTWWMAFGANNWGTVTNPFGTFVFDTITIPGSWNSNEWDWDFAVLEFSPTRFPGDFLGWMGTEQNMAGWQTMIGYPVDKPYSSQWIKGGTYTAAPGSRYEHNLDIWNGDSGACTYNGSSRCTGIQSTHWTSPTKTWNEVRRWDLTTYNFFDTYGNWP